MTDKVEQIRNEVKRLLNEPAPSHDSQCKWEDGYWCALYKIEEFIESLQEEPVSEGRDIFDNCLKSEEKFILPQKISGNINCENCLYSSACALGDIQACIIDKPVSEDLENTAIQYAGKHAPYDDAMNEVEEAFKAGVKWQKEQMIKDAVDAFVYRGSIRLKEWPLLGTKIEKTYPIKLIIIKQEK